jgi:hypothetical protein
VESVSRSARILVTFTSTLLLAVLISSPAVSQHVAGIKVTVTRIDPVSERVDIDITVLYRDFPGTQYYQAIIGSQYDLGQRPAIVWGDGDQVDSWQYLPGVTGAVFPGAPPDTGVFRGSFSHVYGDAGRYEITARTRCCPLQYGTAIATGNVVDIQIPFPGVPGSTVSTSYLTNMATVELEEPDEVVGGGSRCGLGGELVFLLPPLIFGYERRRGRSRGAKGRPGTSAATS